MEMRTRFMSLSAGVSVLSLALLLCLCSPGRGACARGDKGVRSVIMEQPVQVTIESLRHGEDSLLPVAVYVRYKKQGFVFRNELMESDIDQAATVEKRCTEWKEPYLFVYSTCGGGNAWRCDGFQLFKMSGERIAYLGEIASIGSDDPKPAFDGKYFRMVYDRLEGNALTSHAGAPSFFLMIVDEDGKLKANLDATWSVNAAEYERNRQAIAEAKAKGAEMKTREREFEATPLILFNAALAKYCGKKAELSQIMQTAKRDLAGDQYSLLVKELRRVKPGEILPPFKKVKPVK